MCVLSLLVAIMDVIDVIVYNALIIRISLYPHVFVLTMQILCTIQHFVYRTTLYPLRQSAHISTNDLDLYYNFDLRF